MGRQLDQAIELVGEQGVLLCPAQIGLYGASSHTCRIEVRSMHPLDDNARSRADEVMRSLREDPQLDAWAKRLQAQADT